MPTVIDSFVVQLGLDPSNFTKGQKDAVEAFKKTQNEAKSAAKNLEASGKQAGEFFGNIKKEALGLFAVIVGAGGIEQFTARTVGGMAAVGRQAKLMGESASDLVAFKMMIHRTGADAEAAAASFTSLAQAMETWRLRGTLPAPLLTGLNQIGVTNPNAKPIEVYEKFADWAKGKDAQEVNLEGQLLGLDPGSIAKATQGGDAVRAGMAESYRLGVPSDDDISKVTELQDAFYQLQQAVTGEANEMLYSAAPALIEFLRGAEKFVEKNPEIVKAIMAITAAMVALGVATKAAALVQVLANLGKIAPAAPLLAGAGPGFPIAVAAAATVGLSYFNSDAHYQSLLRQNAQAVIDGNETMRLITQRDLDNYRRRNPEKFKGGNTPSAMSGVSLPAGVVAGLYAESGMNPNAQNPTSSAYGAAQWLRPRQEMFRKVMGRDIHGSSLNEQMQFMAWEWTHTHSRAGAAIYGAKTNEEALEAFIRLYEAPGVGTRGDLMRGRRALAAMGASNVTISSIVINTAATDAKGIAKGLGGAIRSNMAQQANSGLTG